MKSILPSAPAVFFLGLIFLAAQSASALRPQRIQHPVGTDMDSITRPFGLDAEGLKNAKIFIAVYTPKTGMGKEQIEITGDGNIKLIRSDNDRASDQIVPGKVEPGKAAALFALFESEGFMDLERTYSTKSTIKNTWQMKLTLPSGEKPVFAESGSTPPQFDRLMGAIRLLAGMGAPKSLGRQYFFHL